MGVIKVPEMLKKRIDAFRKAAAVGDIIVLKEFKAVYFAIPKVANSSLKSVCADLLSSEIGTACDNSAWGPAPFRQSDSRKLLKQKHILVSKRDLSDFKEYWKFALVRNPWDRLVSCYTQKLVSRQETESGKTRKFRPNLSRLGFHPDMSFDEFVSVVCDTPDNIADSHFKSQYLYIADTRKHLLVDYIGRFEKIDEEFEFIFKKLGIGSDYQLPHLLKSKRGDYREYYTPKSEKMVAKRYQTDIEMFKYSF